MTALLSITVVNSWLSLHRSPSVRVVRCWFEPEFLCRSFCDDLTLGSSLCPPTTNLVIWWWNYLCCLLERNWIVLGFLNLSVKVHIWSSTLWLSLSGNITCITVCKPSAHSFLLYLWLCSIASLPSSTTFYPELYCSLLHWSCWTSLIYWSMSIDF